MTKTKKGLLVMAYGTPYKEEDLEAYYTHIRRGRPPAPEQLADLRNRYEAIGGISPLAGITKSQADALCEALNRVQEEVEFVAYVGLKHITPFIEEAIQQMAADGIKEAISIVLAPHFSTFSVKSYNERAAEEAEQYGIQLQSVESWYKQPRFIQYWQQQIEATYAPFTSEQREKTCLIVSAHSLPEKILQNGDPYADQLHETATLLAEVTHVPHYEVGWQSEGQTPEPWLGPDVQDLTKQLAREKGYSTLR